MSQPAPKVTASFNMNALKGPGFGRCYQEMMSAVEACAAYLDGPGRAAAKFMDYETQPQYAAAAMRLSTGFMTVASVGMLLRDLASGRTDATEAKRNLAKVSSSFPDLSREMASDILPCEIRNLATTCVDLKVRLFRYAVFLDDRQPEGGGSPAHDLMATVAYRLGATFGS